MPVIILQYLVQTLTFQSTSRTEICLNNIVLDYIACVTKNVSQAVVIISK